MTRHAVETVQYLRKAGIQEADTGIILGTGLHRLSREIELEKSIPYKDIPGFARSTVESHAGLLLYGRLEGKKIIAMQGRFHLYEGYSFNQIVFPVQVMKELGVDKLFISNAAGAINPGFKKGELMLINSHQNYQYITPPGYTNSENAVSEITPFMKQAAVAENIHLQEGTYAAVSGPQLETRAEYRYLRRMGADAVGMSTVPEIKTAFHLGMQCIAVSVLTDECDPENLKPVTLAEIIAVAGRSDEILTRLFRKTIALC